MHIVDLHSILNLHACPSFTEKKLDGEELGTDDGMLDVVGWYVGAPVVG